MTLRDHFKQMMRERRHYQPGSMEHEWRTRAARKYVWMLRRAPVCDWTE